MKIAVLDVEAIRPVGSESWIAGEIALTFAQVTYRSRPGKTRKQVLTHPVIKVASSNTFFINEVMCKASCKVDAFLKDMKNKDSVVYCDFFDNVMVRIRSLLETEKPEYFIAHNMAADMESIRNAKEYCSKPRAGGALYDSVVSTSRSVYGADGSGLQWFRKCKAWDLMAKVDTLSLIKSYAPRFYAEYSKFQEQNWQRLLDDGSSVIIKRPNGAAFTLNLRLDTLYKFVRGDMGATVPHVATKDTLCLIQVLQRVFECDGVGVLDKKDFVFSGYSNDTIPLPNMECFEFATAEKAVSPEYTRCYFTHWNIARGEPAFRVRRAGSGHVVLCHPNALAMLCKGL